MMFMVKIVPVGDGEFQTTATSADGKVWRKRYKSWPDATADAVDLRMMLPDMKRIVDGYRRMPGHADDGYAPETPYEVDVDELIAHGFVDT
jgi:hypothetical protein